MDDNISVIVENLAKIIINDIPEHCRKSDKSWSSSILSSGITDVAAGFNFLMNVSFRKTEAFDRNIITQQDLTPSPIRKDLNGEALRMLAYWCYWAYIAYYNEDSQLYTSFQPREDSEYNFRYFNSLNTSFAPFFFVYVDPLSNHIIVSIRGTSSITDAITDIVGTPNNASECIGQTVEGEVYVHTGFCRAAKNVIGQLIPYLQEITSGMRRKMDMIITGHSYGAGTGAIVSYIIKEIEYVNIPMINFCGGVFFATPPVFGAEYIDKTCSYIQTTFVGMDIVPTLSNNVVYKLMCDDVKDTITRDLYVPGNILWINYDGKTEEILGASFIKPDCDRLMNISLTRRMDVDHSMDTILSHIYALAHLTDKYQKSVDTEKRRKK